MAAIEKEDGKVKEFIGTNAERLALDTTGLAAHSTFIEKAAGVITDIYIWDGAAWNLV